MTTRTARIVSALWLATALLAAAPAQAERIKDIASIAGVRANQLVGYGVVVGLDGSGDQTTQTPFTVQSIISMLSAMGINMPPGQSLQLKNVAAVMVTASLPAFARAGQNIDITVSSIGDQSATEAGVSWGTLSPPSSVECGVSNAPTTASRGLFWGAPSAWGRDSGWEKTPLSAAWSGSSCSTGSPSRASPTPIRRSKASPPARKASLGSPKARSSC